MMNNLYFSATNFIIVSENMIGNILTYIFKKGDLDIEIRTDQLADKKYYEYLVDFININYKKIDFTDIFQYPSNDTQVNKIMERQLKALCLHNCQCFIKCKYDNKKKSFLIKCNPYFLEFIQVNNLSRIWLELNDQILKIDGSSG